MDEDKENRKERIEKELEFYRQKSKDRASLIQKVLHHPLIFSIDRALYNHRFPKEQMGKVLRETFYEKAASILVAPCGMGRDYQYVKDISDELHGIDLSPIALQRCPVELNVTVGDVVKLPYPDNNFDAVVSTLFFHHLVKMGFNLFLDEFNRVLIPGGKIIILEPSLWYPLNIITRPIKLLGNPFGEVEDEAPFHPGKMIKSLKDAGFININFQSATFSHPSFYVPITKIVNTTSKFLLKIWPFKYLGWLVLYWAEKASKLQIPND
jgi:SAM-dependent methyltransferase